MLGLRDDAGVAHHREHEIPPSRRAREVDGRGVAGRRLHQARQQRRLGQIEVGSRLAEVAERRRFGTVEAGAEIHLVEIELQDLVLRVLLLDAPGENDFLELARIGLLGAQEALTRQLLSQRAAALRSRAVPEVADGRPGDADEVDALVVVEALILDGHDGLNEMGRDARERHVEALFAVNRERPLVVGIQECGRLGHRPDALDLRPVGRDVTTTWL